MVDVFPTHFMCMQVMDPPLSVACLWSKFFLAHDHPNLWFILIVRSDKKYYVPLQIQDRVRRESIKLAEKYPNQCYGQTVTAIDTLSRQRKLFLFPGYNPPPAIHLSGSSAT